MAEMHWTPTLVEERFVEAADVMKRLPEVRVPGLLQHMANDGRRVCRSCWARAAADAAASTGAGCDQPNGGDAQLACMA